MHKLAVTAVAGACALTLSACELRRDGAEQEAPEAEETATPAPGPTATPTPSESASPVTSIIRDEAAPPQPSRQLPPRPVELTIPFPDGSDISDSAERQLVGLMTRDALKQDWPVILGGHTDSGGNDQANLRASRARAEAVAAWLVEHGVADERIRVVAFGEQNPIAPNALPDGSPNEAGRRTNRRVEIRIAPPANAADNADDRGSVDQEA